MNCMMALESAWNDLIEWTKNGLFVPYNEESIQCFLYSRIVNHRQSAVGVFSKPTRGKLGNNDMHFPDFVLGIPEQVVAEIKYARGNTSIFGACKSDVLKMKEKYDKEGVKRVFILFSENVSSGCLNKKQRDELQSHDQDCMFLLYPEQLNHLDSVANAPTGTQGDDVSRSKRRSLSKSEKDILRHRVNAGDSDVHVLSQEFDCSWQQIAGLKAWMQT